MVIRKEVTLRAFVVPLFALFATFANAQVPNRLGAGETAKIYLEALILGETLRAKTLITEQDSVRKYPFGELTTILISRPIFPSLWSVDVFLEDVGDTMAKVDLSISFPEVEIAAAENRLGSYSFGQNFLDLYQKKEVPMASQDFLVNLVFDENKGWLVSTESELYEWRKEKFRVSSLAREAKNSNEVIEVRDELLARFPARAEEVESLVHPLLATATVAEKSLFTNVVLDSSNPQWVEGTYDIAFTFENPTEYTVEYLKVLILLRDDQGVIVERDDLQVFFSGTLPEGIGPGERLRERHPLRARNPEFVAVSVEISILEVNAR